MQKLIKNKINEANIGGRKVTEAWNLFKSLELQKQKEWFYTGIHNQEMGISL